MPRRRQARFTNRRERQRQRDHYNARRGRENQNVDGVENGQIPMAEPLQELQGLQNQLGQDAQQPQNPAIQPNKQDAQPAQQPAQDNPTPHVLGKMDNICEH